MTYIFQKSPGTLILDKNWQIYKLISAPPSFHTMIKTSKLNCKANIGHKNKVKGCTKSYDD
jgi:hypothetical protein